ncbi:MAG: hypothetical protein ONB46_08300 [candidate division KSB1 bacterium]|nr:hypothetical protein [candidate division KSB1 bacterium]MDZ7403792.1 hypothetical protein [candidate division KSB1 bacterium]
MLMLVLAPGVMFAQIPRTNLEMILQLFDRAATHAAAEISRNGESAVWIKSPADAKPEERFLASRLVTVFTDSLRWPVFTEPVDTLNAKILTYRLAHCEIAYRPLPRRRFWQKARWQRTANVLVELGAQNASTRQIGFQKIFSESASDTLATKTLLHLEDQNLLFTIGRRENREESSGWLEPILITSATGVVIYLFYSLRSR